MINTACTEIGNGSSGTVRIGNLKAAPGLSSCAVHPTPDTCVAVIVANVEIQIAVSLPASGLIQALWFIAPSLPPEGWPWNAERQWYVADYIVHRIYFYEHHQRCYPYI